VKAPIEPRWSGMDGDGVLRVLTYVRSNSSRGGTYNEHERVAMSGYLYVSSATPSKKEGVPRYWTCTQRDCNGSLKTDAAFLHGEARLPHLHPPDEMMVGKATAECKLQELVKQWPDGTPPEIVNDFLAQLRPEIAEVMPCRSLLLWRVRRMQKLFRLKTVTGEES